MHAFINYFISFTSRPEHSYFKNEGCVGHYGYLFQKGGGDNKNVIGNQTLFPISLIIPKYISRYMKFDFLLGALVC